MMNMRFEDFFTEKLVYNISVSTVLLPQQNHIVSELVLTFNTWVYLLLISCVIQCSLNNTNAWLAAAFFFLFQNKTGCSVWTKDYLKQWCMWQILEQHCRIHFLSTPSSLHQQQSPNFSLLNICSSLIRHFPSLALSHTRNCCKMLFSSSSRTDSWLSHYEGKNKHSLICLTTYIFFNVTWPSLFCRKTQTFHVAQKASRCIIATPHASQPMEHFLS